MLTSTKTHVKYVIIIFTVVCYLVLHLKLIYFKLTKLHHCKCVVTNIFKYTAYKFHRNYTRNILGQFILVSACKSC